MKRQFIYSLVLLAALRHPALAQTQTQSQRSHWSITLSGGAAIPTSGFAHFSNTVATGTVLPGTEIELSAAYRLRNCLSAVLALSGQQNRGDGIPFLESGSQGKADYTNRYWRMARIQAGPALSIPISRSHRLAILLRALAGIQKTWPSEARVYYPGFNLLVPATQGINPGAFNIPGPLTTNQPGVYPGIKLPWAFSWETDAGFQWTLNNRFAFIAIGGYSDCRPSRNFVYVIGTNTATGQPESYSKHASFPTSTVHVNAGLTYFFPYSKKISVAP